MAILKGFGKRAKKVADEYNAEQEQKIKDKQDGQ